MKVKITLDFYDGRKSKVKDMDLADGFSMQDLMFLMMRAEVAGITITRARPVAHMVRHLESPDEGDEGC